MKTIVSLVVIASLSGCATYNEQQAKNAEARVQSVCDAAGADPRLAAVRPKIPTRPDDASLQQLSDGALPSDAERAAIADILPAYESCWNDSAMFFDVHGAPGTGNLYRSMIQDQKTLLAGLWNRQINYGTFNTARARLVNVTRAQAQAIQDRAASVAQAMQAQSAQNALILLSLQPRLQQPAAQPYQMQAPVRTNCRTAFGQTNCVTQ